MTDTATRVEKKLSVIPKGHWRNKWKTADGFCGPNSTPCGSNEHLGEGRYHSAELAEQAALEMMHFWPDFVSEHGGEYLGPVFFPDP